MEKISLIFLISGLSANLVGQAPLFKAPVYVDDGILPLDVGYYGAPFAYDWNGDNKKDLIVGQLDQGMIRYYENYGENNDPVFNGYGFLQASSTTIVLPSG